MEAQQSVINTQRKILNHVVCSILVECGFDNCEKEVLETLTEMLQAFIYEIGETTRNYCELSGRTEPLLADVVVALINLGIKIDGVDTYGKRHNRTVLPQIQQQTQSKQQNILTAGQKQPHPQHIPNHLPPFPDPHAYIRTATHKQPVTEYEAIREKAATQKRDIERALTRFIAKTGITHSLFLSDDNSVFPLIACKPQFPSYLSALLPQDQIFETEPELEFGPSPVKKRKDQIGDEDINNKKDDKSSLTSVVVASVTGATAATSTTTTTISSTPTMTTTTTTTISTSTTITTTTTSAAAAASSKIKTNIIDATEEVSIQQETIDNPYLQPGKIPKNRLSYITNNNLSLNSSIGFQQIPKKELTLD